MTTSGNLRTKEWWLSLLGGIKDLRVGTCEQVGEATHILYAVGDTKVMLSVYGDRIEQDCIPVWTRKPPVTVEDERVKRRVYEEVRRALGFPAPTLEDLDYELNELRVALKSLRKEALGR